MFGNITGAAAFEIEVEGERLRMLLSFKMNQVNADLADAKKRHSKLVAIEAEQEDHQSRLREVAKQIGAGPATQAGFGPPMFMGGVIEGDTPAEAQAFLVRALEGAKTELLWLHDSINPTKLYKLNRGDLSLFGDFGETQGFHNAMMGGGRIVRRGLGC